ncbi:protein mono-ADP-ribosyltransferase PARP3 isoform X2 [Hyla sarda]|nr:protein mono-ADP-ribosyltransferase PARP3 isoform X2 [Hyla sarda]XP_056381096.1 protein mono-ADP-ribosyltransferase PARP3 isoform X2 [Hyla sarda]XP_056381097.1 protein mono-ADP-ribosyltransferase PARP3 isoform X2 [Hyla sarda]XP_056381098.1 protein mono-ADP-ribosyltransferase PARP3 isoform X2 [Hyla sarda]
MAPKRKAATQTKAPSKGKKVKVKEEIKEEEKEEIIKAPDRFQSAVQALKGATGKKGKAKKDSACPLNCQGDIEVYEDYDCMLNQTNIGNNNNKFYIIQLLHSTSSKNTYYCWNRWGRVGEVGQSKLTNFSDINSVKKDFEKKFKDKTKNNWSDRENFTPHPGKYTMIEVEHDDDEEETGEAVVKVDTVDGVCKKVRPCSLDKPTQDLVSLIFNTDMFKDAMQTMNLDIKKMPLGKLSKAQIAKGFDALEELQAALDRNANKKELSELSSKFFTIIPHNFGRQTPPVIDSQEVLQAKKDMLLVLADIELAQTLQADKVKQEQKVELTEVPHPLDVDYELLKCQLSLLDTKSKEFKVIDTYVKHTGPTYRHLKILNVWRVDREHEEERLKAHEDIDNRRLLWHGTNVAVVAAILKSGLRIMPHSGGRVGRGIYFASENSKSAGYVGTTSSDLGIMFLNEVALGKEHHITQDNSSLKSAPKGYDSVVARGLTEPDPSMDYELILDGRKIIVPQGKPINISEYKTSFFSQSEYLVYKESQARIRYLLLLKF